MSEKEDKAIQDLSDAFDEMFETAEAVKGEQFAQFVGFLVNAQTIIKIMAIVAEESMEAGEYVLADEDHPMRQTITRILNQSIGMYGDAIGMSQELMDEAAIFAKAMHDKINHAEDSMEGEDD